MTLNPPAATWLTTCYYGTSRKHQGWENVALCCISCRVLSCFVIRKEALFILFSSIETLLSAYTSCLESHDYSVVMATARAVPDLVLLCPAQSAHHLLRRLFQLATHSFINCTPELLQAVDACTRHVFQ